MAEDSEFVIELLKNNQRNMAELGRPMDRVDARLTSIKDLMGRLEKRQTAAMHFEQSVLVELTGMNERLDNISAELVGFDRRVTALEAANAR